MVSAIDPTLPIHGTPTTQSVRDNFHIAHDEITALQAATANGPFLPIAGGHVAGPLTISIPTIGVTPAVITNTNPAPAIPAGALDAGTVLVAISGTAGQQAEFQAIGIGGAPSFVGAFAGGTLAAPTPVNVNNAMFQMWGRGFDGTGWFNTANVAIRGAELWTPTAHGTQIRFQGTPTGSTTIAEWARFANGDLLIGSTVDAGYKLDVAGGPVRLGGATSMTAPHIIAATGAVMPTSFASGTLLELVGPPALNNSLTIEAFSNGGAGGIPMITGRSQNSAGGTVVNQNIFQTRAFGWDGSNYSTGGRAAFGFFAAEAFTPTAQGTYITFSTTKKTTTTMAEVARFQDSGNVSIGTTADNGLDRLQVTGSARITAGLGVWNHAAPTTQPAFTGAKGGNTALASVTILVAAGFATDTTTA
jgi:hypothetical protein